MPWNGDDRHSRHTRADRKDVFRNSRDRLKQAISGGQRPRGNAAPAALVLLLVALVVSAFYAFTFRVGADELGIVLRFGKVERHEPPGLHFRLPYPINEVYLPKVTRQNIIEIGFRSAPAREALSHRRL
jgi:modulator of FtsH protease HflK